MTWRDKLEIGLKEDAPFRKDNPPDFQVRGREEPSGLGRCPLPEVSQTIIAEMVGTTRSHVNRFIARFRKLGLVEHHGHALVVDPRLRAVADGEGVRR